MMPIWLQLPLVFALAFISWISGLDSTGNATETSLLWALTALVTGHLVIRFLRGAR